MHKSLESDIKDYVQSIGGRVVKAGYHDVMPKDITETLQFMDDETSMYVRCRKDLVAVLPDSPAILLDAKTRPQPHDNGAKDLLIEARPLAHAIILSRIGVNTVFCCRMTDIEFGFIANDQIGSQIRDVSFPQFRHNQDGVNTLQALLAPIYPNADFGLCGGGGSGDPFCIIGRPIIKLAPHWKDIIASFKPTTE
jgi:hypothetical protein